LVDVLLTLACIIIIIVWHYSAVEVEEYAVEKMEHVEEAEEDSSTSSEEVEGPTEIHGHAEYANELSAPIRRSVVFSRARLSRMSRMSTRMSILQPATTRGDEKGKRMSRTAAAGRKSRSLN